MLTLLLSVFGKIFGYLPVPYEILSRAVVVLIDISIFTLARKIAKNYFFASFALFFFVVLSIPFGVNGLWFDLIQTPFVIVSIFYFYNYSQFRKISDLQKSFYLLIFAVFIKQQVLWLAIFYLTYLIIESKNKLKILLKNLLLPFAFFGILFLAHITYFWRQGSLSDFFFWTIYQPLIKGSSLPGYVSLPTAKQFLITTLPFLIALYMTILKKEKKFMFTFLALPLFLFAYPRFEYFHLIPYLATASIALGVHIKGIKFFSFKTMLFPALLSILLSIFTIHYFRVNWHKPVRFFENDILDAGKSLQEIAPKSIIYIQNGPDQLLPIADLLPPKPWADEFSWYLELGDMQQKSVSAIKSQDPRYVIYKPYGDGDKYALGSYKPDKITDYLNENYTNLIQINDTLWLKVKR